MTLQSIDFEPKSAEELLRWSMDQYGLEAGLASSFGMEDMVLIDMIAKLGGPITLFTLDTGRLHEETYKIMERVRSNYGLEIKNYFPELKGVYWIFQSLMHAQNSQYGRHCRTRSSI